MRAYRFVYVFFFFLFSLFLPSLLPGSELREGRVKLVLHENTGRFSLYYMTDIAKERYEAFFVDQDPRTSFIAVMVNDHVYRLGETSSFRTRISLESGKPAIIFESTFLKVSQEFSFIQSSGTSLTNGVRMDIRIENRGEQQLSVALRFLLDTSLGEKGGEHFESDRRSINSETIITSADADRWWISRNNNIALMGSIKAPGIKAPDSICFANWKRLNDAPWKTAHTEGRNFNNLPYSIGDSALCYYYEAADIARGETLQYSILLAADDENGFSAYAGSSSDDLSRLLNESTQALSNPDQALRSDLIVIRDLIDQINSYISSGASLSEEELKTMELVLARLKARYGLQ